MIKSFKIFENPDLVKTYIDELHHTDKDARAFGYDKKELMLHKGFHTNRWNQDYPGRIWLDRKVISFWEYPKSKSKLRKIITDIENKINQLIWNKGWKIEIPWHGRYKVLPLEQYKGVEDKEKSNQQHTLSPLLKSGKPKGWKPRKTPSLDIRQKMYQENMIIQFENFLNEGNSFKTVKDFLIDFINKKGVVRMKRIREKYIDQLNMLDEFTEDNQTIEKKELTKIKNGLDKLYGIYYGGDKAFQNKRVEDLEKVAINKGVSRHAYNNPDPVIRTLGHMFNYSIKDSVRNLENINKLKLSNEEQDYINEYYPNFDKWVDLHNKLEEVRSILNPTAKERKERELKEIKGKLNPKIKKVIDEIAENFRQVIEKNELNSYERALTRFQEKYGDSVPYELTEYHNRRKNKFSWGGGINSNIYKKPADAPKYSNNYDLVLIEDYQKKMEDTANLVSYQTIAKFQGKMYNKIGGLVTDIDKNFDAEVIGGDWTYNDIFFKFDDGSKFSIRNKIVSNINQHDTFYYTYPTTFHDAYLPDGERIESPNEYNVKKKFNDFYDETEKYNL